MSEFLNGADQTPPQENPQPQAQADQPFLVLGERVFKTQEEVTTKLESADMFIEQLKQENADMRSQLESAAKVEDVLGALKNQEPQQVTQPVVPEVHTPSQDEPSVEELVQQALVKSKATELEEANISSARSAFTGKFGEKSGEVYQNKLKELGMSDDVASTLAKTSPEAFKALFVGTPTQAPTGSIAASTGVNTAALSTQPEQPIKVHEIKDKATRKQEIARRISEAAEKYRNGTL